MLRLIVDEFWRLQRERVGERELSDAKAYLTGSFPLTIETPDAIATQVLNVLFYGLPIEELQSFRERVNAVTADDIERVARSYLRPDRLSIVLVGNASAFTSQLPRVGFRHLRDRRVRESRSDGRGLQAGPAAAERRGAGAGGAGGVGRRRVEGWRGGSQAEVWSRRTSGVRPARAISGRGATAARGRSRRAGPSRQGDRREGRSRDAARRPDALPR